MKIKNWIQAGLLSLAATAAWALPITLSDSIVGGTSAQQAQFQIVVNNGGNIVHGAPHTTWLNGTTTRVNSFYTTTVEGTLATMFLPYALGPDDVINSAVLDLTPSLAGAVGYNFTRNNAGVYTPTFGTTSSSLYAVLSVGAFSMVIDPLAPTVDLAAAIPQILASNQFRIDWMLRTVFTADVTGHVRRQDEGLTTLWTAFATANFDVNAVITLDGDDGGITIDAVPEAGSLLLAGGGLLALGILRRRRQRG